MQRGTKRKYGRSEGVRPNPGKTRFQAGAGNTRTTITAYHVAWHNQGPSRACAIQPSPVRATQTHSTRTRDGSQRTDDLGQSLDIPGSSGTLEQHSFLPTDGFGLPDQLSSSRAAFP